MKGFKRLYTWMMNAKLYMALYSVVMFFLTGIIIVIYGGDSIKLLTMLEILLLCFIIGVLQCFFMDDRTDYSRGIFFGRSCLWLGLSTVLTVVSALIFKWFAGFPAWCPYLLGLFVFAAFAATLMGLKFEQEADTVRLNRDLKKYREEREKFKS